MSLNYKYFSTGLCVNSFVVQTKLKIYKCCINVYVDQCHKLLSAFMAQLSLHLAPHTTLQKWQLL